MELQTKRLVLRNYKEEDLRDYFILRSEPLVWKYSTNVPLDDKDTIKSDLNKVIQTKQFQALFLKGSFQYIGEAGIISYHEKNKRAVIGYNLLPAYWNKGYATEITIALVTYLFESLNTERIEALVMEDNGASRKVLEKAGFMLEGVLRHFTYVNNQYRHVCYYGMIRDDYDKTR